MSILHHKPNQKKVGFKLSLLLLPVLFSFLFSCRYQVPESSLKAVSQKTKDSVDYLPEHYYTLNSNFEVTSDSLLLQQLPLIDVLPVYKGEKLVVAEFMVQAADTVDSVWVKVARDQETMGWVREGELLKKVVPVDPISQFIHLFSSSHTVAFLLFWLCSAWDICIGRCVRSVCNSSGLMILIVFSQYTDVAYGYSCYSL